MAGPFSTTTIYGRLGVPDTVSASNLVITDSDGFLDSAVYAAPVMGGLGGDWSAKTITHDGIAVVQQAQNVFTSIPISASSGVADTLVLRDSIGAIADPPSRVLQTDENSRTEMITGRNCTTDDSTPKTVITASFAEIAGTTDIVVSIDFTLTGIRTAGTPVQTARYSGYYRIYLTGRGGGSPSYVATTPQTQSMYYDTGMPATMPTSVNVNFGSSTVTVRVTGTAAGDPIIWYCFAVVTLTSSTPIV